VTCPDLEDAPAEGHHIGGLLLCLVHTCETRPGGSVDEVAYQCGYDDDCKRGLAGACMRAWIEQLFSLPRLYHILLAAAELGRGRSYYQCLIGSGVQRCIVQKRMQAEYFAERQSEGEQLQLLSPLVPLCSAEI
jgi:hypothetical protein